MLSVANLISSTENFFMCPHYFIDEKKQICSAIYQYLRSIILDLFFQVVIQHGIKALVTFNSLCKHGHASCADQRTLPILDNSSENS
jgi:hypothetical protein